MQAERRLCSSIEASGPVWPYVEFDMNSTASTNTAPSRVPLVDFLVIDDGGPHLVANECTSCGARFFDRRNACAGCYATEFRRVPIAREGVVTAFTIVAFAAPGVPVPFVAAVVDCDGTSVKGNIINVEPDPANISTGMAVRLVTYSLGTDDNGVEAIGYGFEPAY